MNMNLMNMGSSMSPWSRQTIPHKSTLPVPHRNVGGWERLLSAGAGAYLLNKARRAGGMKSYLMSTAGLALIRRGVSGHCGIYNMMGMTSSR